MIDLKILINKKENEDTQWLPMSDLMSGLMILFLFIAVSFMFHAQKLTVYYKEIADNYKNVTFSYDNSQEEIYQALFVEFEKDLNNWKAVIDRNSLTIIFTDPEVLFQTGRSDLQFRFQEILSDFFPRYMQVVAKYQDVIYEVRIEGHTSSEWNQSLTNDAAYFENMRLSQERTRTVLEYVYYLKTVEQYRNWIKKNVSAVGLSSSKIIFDAQGMEDKVASKRVTFRIISNAEAELRRLSELK